NMQILQWKIKHNKDSNNQYLFLTWQKNWQVELAKKINKKDFNFEMIKELHHIKTNKENLLDGSNSSFEILTSLMILYLHDSLKLLGAEPNKLSVDAIVGMVFMI
ncbi:MAG: hypothetical protein U9Q04_07210, partial [Campylobacterota bacterium]|nr:hypothetical protein [Campylobacterota bacterium]